MSDFNPPPIEYTDEMAPAAQQPTLGTWVDVVDQSGAAWDVGELKAKASKSDEQQFVFVSRDLSYMLNRPAKPWLIKNIIGPRDLGMIFGPSASGKSLVCLDMIFAAVTGQQWAMRFDVERPLTVAYCAGEGVDGLPQRFRAAAQRWGVTQAPANLRLFEDVPQLFESTGDSGMRRFINDYKGQAGNEPLDLLFIDTMHSASAGADENSARDAQAILTAAKLAIAELGCAVILVHHPNKGGTSERGSGALRGAMDSMIGVTHNGQHRTIVCEKLKDGSQWKPQGFSLVEMADSVRVWWDDPEQPTQGASQADTIVGFLRDNEGMKFTLSIIAGEIGMDGSSSAQNNAMKRSMESCAAIKREPRNPDRAVSGSNPFTYWYDPDVEIAPI